MPKNTRQPLALAEARASVAGGLESTSPQERAVIRAEDPAVGRALVELRRWRAEEGPSDAPRWVRYLLAELEEGAGPRANLEMLGCGPPEPGTGGFTRTVFRYLRRHAVSLPRIALGGGMFWISGSVFGARFEIPVPRSLGRYLDLAAT